MTPAIAGKAHWLGRNAQAVAARHHDKTGHHTWVDASVLTTYGQREHHPDLFENPDLLESTAPC